MTKALTRPQVEEFHARGFVSGIPVFDAPEVAGLNRQFDRLVTLLDPDETAYVIDGWERYNTWLYELVRLPKILDCVEDVLGPDFYQWGSNFLCKLPHEGIYVPWHQDLHDWPLSSGEVLTVWIAFDDVDQENGCLRMVPGSHLGGGAVHRRTRPAPRGGDTALLPFHLDPTQVDEPEAVDVVLRAGEISLHGGQVMHMSEGNRSGRRRCGFTSCYAAASVTCDSSVRDENGDWSDFAAYPCRGRGHSPGTQVAAPPRSFGRAPRKEYRILDNPVRR
jgi:non-heme Fe2+,alpha-ketoglutarate-dependent halogenase